MNSKMLKFAVSSLSLGVTMVACTPAIHAPASASARTVAKSEQQASTWFAKAESAVQAGDVAKALPFAEKAVELSPRDAGYRMMLADLYLKNGRFQSAETTYEDVVSLDPGNVRAGLSIALARIALGRNGGAIAQLDEMNSAPPADLGLAYALAGEVGRAIEILEPAARASDATPRVRQNLALAYAFEGDLQKARMKAAQDVSPSELGTRMEQWASLARPVGAHRQVAAFLGVTPSADEGQPVQLALAAPEPEATAFASAEPAPVGVGGPVVEAPVEASAETAVAETPAWVSAPAAPSATFTVAAPAAPSVPAPEAEVEEAKPVYAAAVESLVAPQPTVLRASGPALPAPRSFASAPAKAKVRLAAASASVEAPAVRGTGRFAVQLGAFKSAANVERAWAQAYERYGFTGRTPLSTTVSLPNGKFHRLSVAGFGSRAEAVRVCESVKAKGGACFVRVVAGDAPTQWASRYTGARRA